MGDEKSQHRILRALRERVKESSEGNRLKEITDTIGDRRTDDLLDLIATIDQLEGWSNALDILQRAEHSEYVRPLGFGMEQKRIEPLKYREVVFELLNCNGFEPVETTTSGLLSLLDQAKSLVHAIGLANKHVCESAKAQIEQGDNLFFELDDREQTSEIKRIHHAVEQGRLRILSDLRINERNGQINILPLWYTEYGRNALVDQGVCGQEIHQRDFAVISNVIHVLTGIQLAASSDFNEFQNHEHITVPHNIHYRELLEALINGNTEFLRAMGSRFACGFFVSQLKHSLDLYNQRKTSDEYRNLVYAVDSLVGIRDYHTIHILEHMIYDNDARIVSSGISALGNFYHPSSVRSLTDFVCNIHNEQHISLSINALSNLHVKQPHFVFLLKEALDSGCSNDRQLKKLYTTLMKRYKHWLV